ncbi:hypothetical protein ACFL2J_03120 [Candidatus Omnitrophota bacterium]
MGPVEALELALSKEEEALALYKKFYLEFPTAKDTFLFLSNEEEKHKILIKKKISELKSY